MGRQGREKPHAVLVAADLAEAKALAERYAGFGPDVSNGYSLLRMSVAGRLLLVLAAAALIWAAVWWALH
ncbi:MAG TPA: hypothetical protein VNJ31_05710 [Methyloceanibacter sp.]|nr:hypothetical protein [Methyloceanibacter sp.]